MLLNALSRGLSSRNILKIALNAIHAGERGCSPGEVEGLKGLLSVLLNRIPRNLRFRRTCNAQHLMPKQTHPRGEGCDPQRNGQ
jgi:hypothetical protein